MKTYNIEGGINFFDELYKSLDIQENEHKCDDDNNRCLITNEILADKFFEMSCGHKFNYVALYKDLINHKNKFNSMESSAGHLKMNEIRCPYCRHKHTGLLPYYEDLKLDQVHGVNYIDEKQNHTHSCIGSSYKPCESLVINLNYDPSGNAPDELIQCMAYGTKLPPHFGDTKHYCYLHKKLIINKHKRDEHKKLKVAKQQAKDILIAEVKKAKEETNQKLKEEKQKLKEEKQKTKEAKQKTKEAKQKTHNLKDELANLVKEEKQKTQKLKDEIANLVKDTKPNKKTSGLTTDNENVVIQILPFPETANNKGCIELLKTGINKGTKCGCKFYIGEYCKRHYKLPKNNSIITNEL
jgi:hypothetical protein